MDDQLKLAMDTIEALYEAGMNKDQEKLREVYTHFHEDFLYEKVWNAVHEGDHSDAIDVVNSDGFSISERLKNDYGRILLTAGYKGWGNLCQALIEKGADRHVIGGQGETLLITAAKEGKGKVVMLALEYGCDVNAKDRSENSAIHYSAYRGDVYLIEQLLEKGALIDAKGNEGRTPLINAIQEREFDAAKFLLEKGADIEAKNNYGVYVRDFVESKREHYPDFCNFFDRFKENLMLNEVIKNDEVSSVRMEF